MTIHYTTRQDAIDMEIIAPIEATGEATRDEYDIDAIADAVLSSYDEGFVCIVDDGAFWQIVSTYAR